MKLIALAAPAEMASDHWERYQIVDYHCIVDDKDALSFMIWEQASGT